MNEKPESEDFEDDDGLPSDGEDTDLDRATRELESARRRGNNSNAVPALRRLELLMEKKRTAELISDFDDYDIDEPAS
jgi:hypothetical protein